MAPPADVVQVVAPHLATELDGQSFALAWSPWLGGLWLDVWRHALLGRRRIAAATDGAIGSGKGCIQPSACPVPPRLPTNPSSSSFARLANHAAHCVPCDAAKQEVATELEVRVSDCFHACVMSKPLWLRRRRAERHAWLHGSIENIVGM
jgi:hypothetical protein